MRATAFGLGWWTVVVGGGLSSMVGGTPVLLLLCLWLCARAFVLLYNKNWVWAGVALASPGLVHVRPWNNLLRATQTML